MDEFSVLISPFYFIYAMIKTSSCFFTFKRFFNFLYSLQKFMQQ